MNETGSPFYSRFVVSGPKSAVMNAAAPTTSTFWTSKRLLHLHSGFFRSVFDRGQSDSGIVVVPFTIPAQAFGVILSSLVNPLGLAHVLSIHNVYQFMLYGEALEMPVIAEQCRALLNIIAKEQFARDVVQQPSLGTDRPHIIRPIPLLPSTGTRKRSEGITEPGRRSRAIQASQTAEEQAAPHGQESPSTEARDVPDCQGKVHLERASCDGPVRFIRVENPNAAGLGGDDDGKRPKRGAKVDPGTRGDAQKHSVYRCLFCRHIFKSRYCYEKHKQRHLNPSGITEGGGDRATNSPKSVSNVQFFPCKICGAKFPSYYFVHKHKRVWHASSE